MRTAIVTSLCLLAGTGALAQSPAVKKFSGAQVKDSVYLFLTMHGGYTCNGIGVQRGADSLTFHSIGDIQGVCGDPDFDTDFTFVDTNPIPNAVNFYRLDLGNYGFSEVLPVYFRAGTEAGVTLSANPCAYPCMLYFGGPPRPARRLSLSDSEGRLLIDTPAPGNTFSLAGFDLPAGIYHYRLHDDETVWSGSFTVVR